MIAVVYTDTNQLRIDSLRLSFFFDNRSLVCCFQTCITRRCTFLDDRSHQTIEIKDLVHHVFLTQAPIISFRSCLVSPSPYPRLTPKLPHIDSTGSKVNNPNANPCLVLWPFNTTCKWVDILKLTGDIMLSICRPFLIRFPALKVLPLVYLTWPETADVKIEA